MRLLTDDESDPATIPPPPRRQLDLTGVDAGIARQLERIAAAARRPRCLPRLRRQLAQVAVPVRRAERRGVLWRVLHDNDDDLWSSSNVALLALAAAAAASLALAVSPLPGGYTSSHPEHAPAVVAPSTGEDARSVSNAEAFEASDAKDARDRARAARFLSEKSESKTYAAGIHLAAERKEIEADFALGAGKYALAVELYDLARDGYVLARTRAERSAAEIDRARIEEQMVADARRARGRTRPRLLAPPEECAVAHAVGFGIAAGACGPARREAEIAALTRCQDKLAARYGRVDSTCSLAWLDPSLG